MLEYHGRAERRRQDDDTRRRKSMADQTASGGKSRCISTGVFMFPNERAAEIAVETVRKYLDETGSRMKVIFNVYKETDREIYQKLL